jgi:hypothetical protein
MFFLLYSHFHKPRHFYCEMTTCKHNAIGGKWSRDRYLHWRRYGKYLTLYFSVSHCLLYNNTLKKLINNSWGTDKENHHGGFLCDKKIMFIHVWYNTDGNAVSSLWNVGFSNHSNRHLIYRYLLFADKLFNLLLILWNVKLNQNHI